MRILVVEDEPVIADAVQIGLEAEGYIVDVSARGDEGLWKAQENDYDCIILDIMLPAINGYRICSTLRTSGDMTPILMLTAKDGKYDVAEGLDTGADDYITKPFEWVEFIARVRAMTRRSRGNQSSSVLSIGDLQLDTATRQVYRGTTMIELTPREFALLRYLMHRQDQVVTKQELLDHVWGQGEGGVGNVVQVYVRYLRQKVDEPFGEASIQTVRGFGYTMSGRPKP